MQAIFWYSLGYALDNVKSIELFAACLMSTHPHYNIGDALGEAPKFFALFHRALALGTKAFRGWTEECFNKSSTSAHEPLTVPAMVRSIAYTIANPVAAFAVRFACDWPGATVRPEDIGTLVFRVKRPKYYFRDEKKFKDEYVIRLTMPQVLLDHYGSLALAQQAIRDAVSALEKKAHKEATENGYFFKGKFRVLKMKHTKRASSYEVFGSRSPTFAAGGELDAAKLAIAKLREFRAKYREALELYKVGKRDLALFPYGTWQMVRFHHCACEPPPQV